MNLPFDTDQLVVMLTALLAGLSFVAVALPAMRGEERKAHLQARIQKHRKSLLDAQKDKMGKPTAPQPQAKDNMAALFKMRKLAGEMGEKLRTKMILAGYRSPAAPITFLIIKCVLPVVFALLAMMVLSKKAGDLDGGVTMLILCGVAAAGYGLPGLLLKNQMLKRQLDISLSFPDALDMILICVEGGIGIEQAIDRISSEVAGHSPVLAEELGILSAELSMMDDRRQAYQDFAKRVGTPSARAFAMAMLQAEQYGTSIAGAMRVLAEDQRDQRMAEAERKAAALPPKLTVPMILFFLPSLFIVILGPAGIQAAGLN